MNALIMTDPIRNISIYLFLAVLLLATACEEPRAPEESNHYFANFFVRYLAVEQQLKSQATFLSGDSLNSARPVSFNTPVLFQGESMDGRKIPGDVVRYSWLNTSAYPEQFQFQFQRLDGEVQQLTAEMSPIRDFFLKGPLSITEGINLVINGGVLEEEESLVLIFSDETNRATSITVEGPYKTIEYNIPPKELYNLSTGPGKLYLVKKQQRVYDEKNISATSTIEFYSDVIPIEIVE